MLKGIALMLAAALVAHPSHSQVFRCTVDGRAVFSDQPCSDDAVVIEVRPAAGATGDTVSADQAATARRESIESMARDRRLREIERETLAVERRMREQNRAMDRDMQAVRDSMRYSNNNLAGATRDVSLTQEMQAIAHRYQVQAETDRARLDLLRSEREALLR